MNERETLTEALNRPGKAERARYLDEACGADARLRARLEFLLAMHQGDRTPPDPPTPQTPDDSRTPESPGEDSEESTPGPAIAPLLPFLGPPQRPDSLGRLGHYEVLEVLGQGGYGIVLRALDEKLERVVAIKVLAPTLAMTAPPRKRFLREARAAAQIRHENVVQVYAVQEQPIPYLVMEFIAGQTMQGELDTSGPLDPAEVVRLGTQIAQGLAAAHEKGLIHRDIKPANILLEAGPEVCARLTDFGLARTTDDTGLTTSGALVGTPMYMAPEQAKGEELDHRADLFSLGSVLYAMCTGQPPFRAPNTLALLKRVAEDEPRPIRGEVPEGLCAVIARLHRKDPAERFASAEEVARALSRCLTDPAPKPAGRRWKGVVAVAAVLALLLVGAGWAVREFTRPAAGGSPPDTAPKGDPWEEAVARMDAEDQLDAVVTRLKQLNRQFNEKSIQHRIENDVVVALNVTDAAELHDITPLHALAGLKDVHFHGKGKGVADIGPLRGLKSDWGKGMDRPLAYFLTFTCYGTWLHGDERGSVDDDHNVPGTPVLRPDPERHTRERETLFDTPYQLDGPRRRVTLEALCEIARRKGWALHAAHVRSNHVHLVVTGEGPPERILNDFKTAASRRLNKAFPAERDRTRWTRHGSTRYLWTEVAVAEKVWYVLDGQGEPLERFPEPGVVRAAHEASLRAE